MNRIFLSFVFFFSVGLVKAENIQIKPTSVVIHVGSASIIKGVYSDQQNENYSYDLIDLKVVGKYDEAVIAYQNIQPGKYNYRFAKISKDLGSFSDCRFHTTQSRLSDLRYEIKRQTDRRVLLSAKGAETAEFRLTSVLPPEESGGPVTTEDSCGGPATLADIIGWQAAAKPSTDWQTIEVKTAKNLVISIPRDIYEGTTFELVLVK